jgi:hypothetical protein
VVRNLADASRFLAARTGVTEHALCMASRFGVRVSPVGQRKGLRTGRPDSRGWFGNVAERRHSNPSAMSLSVSFPCRLGR